jgi:DNA-binding GntR family transcriptional regulator
MVERKEKSSSAALKRQPYLSLTDIAYNVLVEAIINQEFQPGAPVSIDYLAKQLNMSNTPVREALMRAHGERLVTQKTNHGFVVAEILTPGELHHLFEVRHVLEVYALNTADLTTASVEAIANLIEQMTTTADGTVYDDFRDFMTLDRQFHRALVALTSNDFLVDSWEDLHVHLHLSRLYTGVGLFDRNDSTREHRVIVEALQQGDQKKAADLLSDHIQRVEKRMLSFLEK